MNVGGVGAASAHAHAYTFLVGPTFAYRREDKFVPFGHFLIGIAHGSSSAQTNILGQNINVSSSDTGFGLAVGGGVDYELNESWAIRPVQIDYVSGKRGTENEGQPDLPYFPVGISLLNWESSCPRFPNQKVFEAAP